MVWLACGLQHSDAYSSPLPCTSPIADLVARATALLDNRAQLLELPLRAQERAQLSCLLVIRVPAHGRRPDVRASWSACAPSCPGNAVSHPRHCSADTRAFRVPERALAPWLACRRGQRTFELRSSSITRRSYGAKPATSRTTERTNLVLVDETPLRCDGFGVCSIAVVGWPLLRP